MIAEIMVYIMHSICILCHFLNQFDMILYLWTVLVRAGVGWGGQNFTPRFDREIGRAHV